MKQAVIIWLGLFLACLGSGVYLIRQDHEYTGIMVIMLGFLLRVQVREY